MKTIKWVLLISFILATFISGCGRNQPSDPSEMEISFFESSMEYTAKEMIDDNSNNEEHLTTQETIKRKKEQQLIKAGAVTDIMKEGDIKNILLIGQDRRPGDKAQMRSDCMMIFSINNKTKSINLLSLMRDMYIPCADGKEGMINLTYLNGGAELLKKTIEDNFGIHIDNYVEVDFQRFMALFDMIGPIDVEVTEAEANIINNMKTNHRIAYYDYGNETPVWNLHAGINSLDPEQMLSFCRVRKDIGGDWARTERQRRAVKATYEKMMNLSMAGLIRNIKDSQSLFKTDMSLEEMLGYVYILKKNEIMNIQGFRIPLDDTYTQEIREETLHVIIPELEPNKEAAMKYIYGS